MSQTDTLDLVAIEKVASVDYLTQVFACYEQGRIAVPVDRGVDAPAGYAFAERIVPEAGGGWFTLKQAPIRDDRPAQVSYSSGTTGTPKAILLSHRALADVTDRLIDVMEIDADIAEYLGVPPTYSFGLGRARVTAAVGGRLYIPEHGFDPLEFARMLQADEINALSAVPTLLRALLANPDLVPKKVARRLRWLEIGSQPMSAEEKRAVRRMFPAARIIQHYGLTEASRTTFLDIQEASDAELESVGRPIGATEVVIGDDGRIAIRGPHVTDGLLKPEGLDPAVDAEGWLVTRDAGRIAGGFLYFEGRTDDLINCGGVKVPAETFEAALRSKVDGVLLAAGPMPDPQRGQRIAVACEGSSASVRAVADVVAAEFGVPAAAVTVFEVDELPRTETGKIKRRELAALAPVGGAAPVRAASAAGAAEDRLPRTDAEKRIAALWEQALKVSPIYRDESFFGMGGDSLSAINVLFIMDRAGIPGELSRRIFEGRTIAELAYEADGGSPDAEDAPPSSGYSAEAMVNHAVNIGRGLLVLVVLAGHWGPFFLERLGGLGESLSFWLNPLFRFGTPGFALIFGLGVGYFQYHGMKRSPEGVIGRLRVSLMIVGGGIVINALVLALRLEAVGPGLGSQWPTALFYSVLPFYFLAMLTINPLLRTLDRWPHVVLNALIASVTLYIAYLLCVAIVPAAQSTGFLELFRLMLVAKYSYFGMLSLTCIGIAIGLWLRLNLDRPDLSQVMIKGGLAIGGAGMALAVMEDGWRAWFIVDVVSALMEIGYAGVIIIVLGTVLAQLRGKGPPMLPRDFAQHILSLLGILSFPIFIGHRLVEPVKETLVMWMPAPIAFILPLGAFLGLTGYAMFRLNRVVNAGRWLGRR